MSAFITECDDCGQRYIAGMVGTTPWPSHECPPIPTLDEVLPYTKIGLEREGWDIPPDAA